MTLRREDLDGGIAVLTIDRPEARNALSPETRSEIAASFEAMAADDAVRAVVLTGAGEHFCAGGDVKTMGSREPSAMEDRVAVMVRVAELLITFPKPLVAAVRGHAAGAGASIACLADVVVAADSAKFTVSFLNIGLVPDWGLTHTLQRRVGPAAARRLALTRERVDADEAHRLGLADVRAPDGEVMAVALERARALAASALGGYAALKSMMEDRDALRAALRAEAQTQIERSKTWEHREGVAAFREKRRPDYARAATA
ncbi:MAG: enoyl-CoA hydratase/isomerase family protein [Immundisolibacterales bacterium]|nr:enoyl-CoA hydratase/isomerase family protein [Immundisolibacterales bacterium]